MSALSQRGQTKQTKELNADVQKIFEYQHGIQMPSISELGSNMNKLSHSSGDSHPAAPGSIEGIIADLGLTHIQAKSSAAYIALTDTMC